MPSPLLHAGAALAVGRLFGEARPRTLAWTAALALWPDLDLLPGLLLGDPHLYHHGATHSLLVQAAAAWAVSRWAGVALPLALAAGLSHCALDLFNHDPFGDTPAFIMSLPLFWPSAARVPMLAPLLDGARFPADPRQWSTSANLLILGRDLAAAAEGARRLVRRPAPDASGALAGAR